MTRRYILSRLILPIALFVIPYLSHANGEPKGNPDIGGSSNHDSTELKLGHCNPVTFAVVNCAAHTIELTAYVQYLFSGQLTPWNALWNTGEQGFKITVVPPGAWSWDPSTTGCEPNHWENTYNEPGTFFYGIVDITGPPLCENGSINLTVLPTDSTYHFVDFQWNPSGTDGQLSPHSVDEPGLYTLTLTDQLGCPFLDTYNVPMSPPVVPSLSGPLYMCPEGDTGIVKVNQFWNAYLWPNGETTNAITVTEPGLYQVTVTNQFGCTGQGVVGVQTGEVTPFPISMTAQKICLGDPDTLRVVGGFSQYHWSNNVNTITNIVTQPGTYVVTVTNVHGCTGVDSVMVGLKPTPTIAITSTPFCPGGSSTLMATGGMPQYLWSTTQTTNPIIVSTPGTYTVTVSGTTICPTTKSITVVQLPPPITVIAAPAQLNCVVPQTNLDAMGSSSDSNFTFIWTTVGGNFVSGQNTLQPTVNAAGVYTLVITNMMTGCTSSAAVTVTSNIQLPPAPAGDPATLTCVVTNLNIGPVIPPSDTTLLLNWVASGGGNIISGQNSWNPNVNQPGTYTLTVTNPANSCTNLGSVIISQNTSLPSSLIAPPSQLTCTMNTVALNGSGSSSGPNFAYQWSTTLGGTISGNPNTASTTAASVGTYTLLVTNITNGCTAISSVDVTADLNIPIASALPPATLTCVVPSVVINASASSSGPAYTYTWTGPGIIAGQGTLQPTVNAPGTYTLNLLNTSNSCFATLSIVVPQDIVPPVANAGQNATLNCVIPTLNLDGTASAVGPNFTYQWTSSNGIIVSGATGLTPTVSLVGDYNLLVTNTINGCTSVSSVQVLNDASAPVANIANPSTLTCTTLQTIINALASTQGSTYNYSWSGPGIVSGQGTLQPTVNLPGVYTLDIINTANGCTDTKIVTVPQDIVAPVALAGNDGLINCTTPAGSVGSLGNPLGPNFTLSWSTVGGNFTSATNGPTATINAAGTYVLLVTNTTNGCTDTDDVIVLADFVQPTVDAGPGFQLTCTQTTYTMQGTGSVGANFSYLWTAAMGGNILSGGTTLTPTVNTTGTYTLKITNNINGCTSTDQVVITQSAGVPISTIATPNILTCSLTSLNLNAAGSSVSPSITYAWTSTNGGNITGGGTTLMPTINTPGTYTLQTTDAANSCTSVAVINVLQNIVAPVVEAGNPNTLTCTILNLPLAASITSSSSPNLVYKWSTTNGTILSGGNTLTPTVGAIGLYTLLVTDNINGCTGTDNVQIVADVAQPVAAIAQPQTLTCTLMQTQVNGTASSQGSNFTYIWTTPNGHILSGPTTNQPVVDDPGTYNLLVTNTTNGCTQTASVNVPEDVVPPTAIAGPSVGLDCDTQTNGLNGNASSQGPNFTYLWSTTTGQILSGGTTLTPQIGDPGTYVLTINNMTNGCVSSSSVLVTEDVNPPVFVIAPAQLLTCVLTSTPVEGSGSGFGNAPTYTWSTTGGNIVSGGNTLKAMVDAPGTYTLTVLNTQNGCTDAHPVVVTENVNPPTVNTLPVQPLTCTVLERTLQANTQPQVLLQWSTQNGHIVSGATTANPVVDEPGLYVVVATLPLNGCTNVANVPLLREQNIPTGLEFLLDPPHCNGTLGLLTVEQINGGIGPFDYSIDGGATFFPAQDIDGLQPGSYDLVIRDVNGCKIMQQVPVPAPPTPLVSLPPSFSIVLGDNQDLLALVPPAFPISLIDQVIWEPMTGLTFTGNTIAELLNPVAKPFVTTEYKVTILSKEGCKADSRTIIRVDRNIDIYAPNVIWTDDQDSGNNAFTLFTRPGSVNQILSLQIYDRWGEQLFVNKNFLPDDTSLGWPGDYKGVFVNPGVFVWWAEVELIDGQKLLLKGDVTVVR